jgi:hypothetical protein
MGDFPVFEVAAVDVGVVRPAGREAFRGKDGGDRAYVYADAALDAALGVDVQLLGGREGRVLGARADAIDRTHLQAGIISDTWSGDYKGHRVIPSTQI